MKVKRCLFFYPEDPGRGVIITAVGIHFPGCICIISHEALSLDTAVVLGLHDRIVDLTSLIPTTAVCPSEYLPFFLIPRGPG